MRKGIEEKDDGREGEWKESQKWRGSWGEGVIRY